MSRHLKMCLPSLPKLTDAEASKGPPTSSLKGRVLPRSMEEQLAQPRPLTSREEPPLARAIQLAETLQEGRGDAPARTFKGKGHCLHFSGLYCFKGYSVDISHNRGRMSEFLMSYSGGWPAVCLQQK